MVLDYLLKGRGIFFDEKDSMILPPGLPLEEKKIKFMFFRNPSIRYH